MSARALKRRKLSDVEATSDSLDGHDSLNNARTTPTSSSNSSPFPDFDSSDDATRSSVSQFNSDFSDDTEDDPEGDERNVSAERESLPTARAARPSRRKIAHNRPELKINSGNVSRSEVLKLQVDELLGQVRLTASEHGNEIDSMLRSLKKTLEAIPGKAALSVRYVDTQ